MNQAELVEIIVHLLEMVQRLEDEVSGSMSNWAIDEYYEHKKAISNAIGPIQRMMLQTQADAVPAKRNSQ